MKKFCGYFLWLFFILTLSACGTQPPASTKSPLALQAIQSKEFQASKKIVFAATLSVFQDMGFIIEAASLDTGLITSKSLAKESYNFFYSTTKSGKATAFVEELTPDRTKVRINIVYSENTSHAYGRTSAQDMPVESPTVYQSLFSKIQQGVFVRKNVQ